MTTLLHLLLALAIVGFIAWLIITYIPMPQVMKTIIVAVLAIVMILWLLGALGGGGLKLPSLG
jgi:Flp pilus assembly protein protease CpaA